MIDEKFYHATLVPADDSALRLPQMAQMGLLDPLQGVNQLSLIHDQYFSGRPGYDFQNPYVWQTRDWLSIAPTLDPQYGIRSDTPESVARNIAGTSRVLKW